MVFHSFSIIYFHLVKYLYPDRVIEMDDPADIIENLEPFTDATWTCSPPTPVRLTGVGNYMTALRRLIPIPKKNHWCAQSRSPIDMILQGWSMSWFHAKHEWSTMSL